MRVTRFLPVVVSLALLSGACFDDGSSPEEGELTEAEAEALAALILDFGFQAGLEAQGGSAPAGPRPTPHSFEFERTEECEVGGLMTAEVSGQLEGDMETLDLDADIQIVLTPEDCGLRDEDSGQVFTIDGAPNLNSHWTISVSGGQSWTADGTLEGTIDWETEGRRGACRIDLDFEAGGEVETPTGTGSMSGTVCGAEVNETITVG